MTWRSYQGLLGAGMAAALLLGGGTALADSHHSGGGDGGPGTCNFIVTGLSSLQAPGTGNPTAFDVAITVADTGNVSGTWTFPDPSDPNVNQNPQALPTLNLTDQQTGQTFTANASSLESNATLTAGGSGTADYAFNVSLTPPASPSDTFSIQLANHSGGQVFHMYQVQNGTIQYNSTSPVCDGTPVPSVSGQLPEVPAATLLPLAGLAAVGATWYGKRRRRRAHPA